MRSHHRSLALLVAALLVAATALVASGCTSAKDASSSASSASSAPASGPNDLQMTDSPAPQASPTWDATEHRAARDAARDALAAFAKPGTQQAEWWRDLAPLMTPAARKVYNTVDTTVIPVSKVNGAGRVVDATSPYMARVEFGTDAGAYTVLVTRSGAGGPWLAERIEPGRSR